MANKKKAPIKQSTADLDREVQYGTEQTEETVITTPRGAAVGIAMRFAETEESFRALITIRFGTQPEKIKFNFGNDGPQVRGGGPGDPPPCP